MPGADDGTGGVVGASRFCESPILLGDRLGKGGGGGGGMTIATKITQFQTKYYILYSTSKLAGLRAQKGLEMYLGWTNVMTCYFVDVIFAVVEVDVKHDSFVE